MDSLKKTTAFRSWEIWGASWDEFSKHLFEIMLKIKLMEGGRASTLPSDRYSQYVVCWGSHSLNIRYSQEYMNLKIQLKSPHCHFQHRLSYKDQYKCFVKYRNHLPTYISLLARNKGKNLERFKLIPVQLSCCSRALTYRRFSTRWGWEFKKKKSKHLPTS